MEKLDIWKKRFVILFSSEYDKHKTLELSHTSFYTCPNGMNYLLMNEFISMYLYVCGRICLKAKLNKMVSVDGLPNEAFKIIFRYFITDL